MPADRSAAKPPKLTPEQEKVLTEDIPKRLAEETHDAWTGEQKSAAVRPSPFIEKGGTK